jgi:hypothetical protein
MGDLQRTCASAHSRASLWRPGLGPNFTGGIKTRTKAARERDPRSGGLFVSEPALGRTHRPPNEKTPAHADIATFFSKAFASAKAFSIPAKKAVPEYDSQIRLHQTWAIDPAPKPAYGSIKV